MGGVRCVVRGVEGCGSGRGVWWEGWWGLGCIEVCGERGGGMWEW